MDETRIIRGRRVVSERRDPDETLRYSSDVFDATTTSSRCSAASPISALRTRRSRPRLASLLARGAPPLAIPALAGDTRRGMIDCCVSMVIGAVVVKARTLLLLCGLSLAAATAAETPAVEPIKDNGRAAMPPVSVSDAGGGRVRIEAHDASLDQVLAALQDSHLIQFSTADPLSGTVTGTYTGTLPQVLSRILDGHNYFLRVTASGTELHAVNVSNATNLAVGSSLSLPSPASEVQSRVTPSTASETQPRVTPSPAAKARERGHDF